MEWMCNSFYIRKKLHVFMLTKFTLFTWSTNWDKVVKLQSTSMLTTLCCTWLMQLDLQGICLLRTSIISTDMFIAVWNRLRRMSWFVGWSVGWSVAFPDSVHKGIACKGIVCVPSSRETRMARCFMLGLVSLCSALFVLLQSRRGTFI